MTLEEQREYVCVHCADGKRSVTNSQHLPAVRGEMRNVELIRE